MVKYSTKLFMVIFTGIFATLGCSSTAGDPQKTQDTKVSGNIQNGYRVITLDEQNNLFDFSVYRGDYVKFRYQGFAKPPTVYIPKLDKSFQVEQQVHENTPYIKIKDPETLVFMINGERATLQVREYRQPQYRELSAIEARTLIRNLDPIILDVRTPWEYEQGHLPEARLIPVQSLQNRVDELEEHKNRDILVYCRSGNRSTVASKLLIDEGFNRIYNLRYGILEWEQKGYSLEYK